MEKWLRRKWFVLAGVVPLLASLFLSMAAVPALAKSEPEQEAKPQHQDGGGIHPTSWIRTMATTAPTGLSPAQIRAVYNLPSSGGNGTIAIVDAYDDPTVENDLNVFSTRYGLPTANFEKHLMATNIAPDAGWALETSLDVQWAHAIAPSAKILLVVARSATLSDLLAAVDYARIRPDVVAISMSWGGGEFSTETSYDSHFTSAYGATFFASAGDSGAGAMWPAVSPNIVAVGGTLLTLSGGALVSETAWSGSGGGVSAYEPAPAYQVTYGVTGTNGKRAVPDVSYNADPASGVSVYDSTVYQGASGWYAVGGTSAGAPQWAAIKSLGLSTSNSNFYQDARLANASSYFRDITSGSNGHPAGTGYDLVTGLGSPLTTNYAAVTTPDFSLSSTPSSQSVTVGATATYSVSVIPTGGFSSPVNLSVAGLPAGATSAFSINPATASSVLSVATAGTPVGTYPLTITGTSGTLAHTTAVTLVVGTPGFTLSVSPASRTVRRGSNASYTVTVTRSGGFSGAVNLSATGLPAGTTWSFNPNPATGSSTFRVNTSRNTPTGTYILTIKGVNGGLSSTVPVTLTVTR